MSLTGKNNLADDDDDHDADVILIYSNLTDRYYIKRL